MSGPGVAEAASGVQLRLARPSAPPSGLCCDRCPPACSRRRVSARCPAGLAGRPSHTAGPGAVRFRRSHEALADRQPNLIRSLTERNCLAMNPNAQVAGRPNVSTPGKGLCAVWRRLRLIMRGDPVASVMSPAAAVRLADETLALIAVAGGAAAMPAAQRHSRHGCRRRATSTLTPDRARRYGQAPAAAVTSVSARIFRRRMPDSAPTRAPGGTSTTSRSVLRAHAA